MDNIDGFNDEVRGTKGDVKNMDAKMIAGFGNEVAERRNIYDCLEVQREAGLRE